jgi:nucleoside-diphosphate-sugar epimerase
MILAQHQPEPPKDLVDNQEGRSMDWNGKRTLVTGGCSFIGSHLVEALSDRGAFVRVVDNLSSGKLEYLQPFLAEGAIEFLEGDLLDAAVARRSVDGMEVVFHLAADHGGRGYVDLHQAACATNLTLDGNVFLASRNAGVERVLYASSGCVYPNFLQQDPKELLYLTEGMVGPPYDADNMYGWAKLMGEMALKSFCTDWGMKAASCRYFTVFGERGKEDHAIMAMIAKAFVRQDPFSVWGNGDQVRNWTYVGDIVRGTILAAEKVNDGTAVNLGTMERTTVLDAVKEIMAYTGHTAELEFHPEMPTGPVNRVADNSLARNLLGWEPDVSFTEGLHRTIDWYFSTKDPAAVALGLEHALVER